MSALDPGTDSVPGATGPGETQEKPSPIGRSAFLEEPKRRVPSYLRANGSDCETGSENVLLLFAAALSERIEHQSQAQADSEKCKVAKKSACRVATLNKKGLTIRNMPSPFPIVLTISNAAKSV